MNFKIPRWLGLFLLLGIGYLIEEIFDKAEMDIYKKTFNFNVDSLQRVLNVCFNPYELNEEKLKPEGCFVFSLESDEFTPMKSVNDILPNNINPKSNQIKYMVVVKEGTVSSGTYTNGTSGIQHFSDVYFFSCSKHIIICKEQLMGSEPPSSGRVRSGGRLHGSFVTSKQIADCISNKSSD